MPENSLDQMDEASRSCPPWCPQNERGLILRVAWSRYEFGEIKEEKLHTQLFHLDIQSSCKLPQRRSQS